MSLDFDVGCSPIEGITGAPCELSSVVELGLHVYLYRNAEIIFQCELCSKDFSHKKSLLAHYRGAHRVEPSNSDGALQNYHCVHCENAVFATLTRLRCHYVDTHHFDPVTQVRNEELLSEFGFIHVWLLKGDLVWKMSNYFPTINIIFERRN